MPARWSRRRRSSELFANPRHPYTQGLIRSIPRIDTRGDPQDAAGGDRRAWCRACSIRRPAAASRRAAATRCANCREAMPPLREIGGGPQGRLRAVRTRWRPRDDRAAAARQRPGQELRRQAAACSAREVDTRPCRRSASASTSPPGETLGPGRRIRLRQVDHRPLHPAADRADRRARSGSRARNVDGARRATSCARCAATCRSSSRTRSPRSIRA